MPWRVVVDPTEARASCDPAAGLDRQLTTPSVALWKLVSDSVLISDGAWPPSLEARGRATPSGPVVVGAVAGGTLRTCDQWVHTGRTLFALGAQIATTASYQGLCSGRLSGGAQDRSATTPTGAGLRCSGRTCFQVVK